MRQYLFKIVVFIIILLLQSCISLKPYERIYVNDSEMKMGMELEDSFRNYVYTIREGAVTPSSTKSSGGCGCN